MRFLLDTSTYLWFVTVDERLNDNTRKLLEDSEHEVFLSLASIWEMAIKSTLGRGLELPSPFHQFIDDEIERDRFRTLNITVSHIKRVAELPLIHRDPFDRLLIAQSLVEDLPIITSDGMFDAYAIQEVW